MTFLSALSTFFSTYLSPKSLPVLCCCRLLCIAGLISLTACENKNSIHLGVTTTLDDAGALALLVETFEQKHPLKIKAVIAGSGQIHRLIESGDIDTAITHDPAGEQALLAKQLISARLPLIKNDFVIIGPNSDPAHIKQALTPDEALEKIANTGAVFVSRDDESGTHQMEKYWRKKIAYSEDKASTIKTGNGMGATLAVAIDKKAYTLVDRGTWLNYANKGDSKVLFEDADYLPNIYSILQLATTRANTEEVRLWENWLATEGSALLKAYRIDGQTVFFSQE